MLFVCIDACAYYRLSELEERIKYPLILLLYLFIWGRIFLRLVCEFYMCECFTCMLAYAPHACLVAMEVGRDQKIPWTGVKDGWESLCRCWESILGPLKEQQMILTSAPSPLPQRQSFPKSKLTFSSRLKASKHQQSYPHLSWCWGYKWSQALCLLLEC